MLYVSILVEYLFVRNLRLRSPFQSMEVSYSRHWKKRNTVEVGHRGAGNSYTKYVASYFANVPLFSFSSSL